MGPDHKRWDDLVWNEDGDDSEPDNGGQMEMTEEAEETFPYPGDTTGRANLHAKILKLMASVGYMRKDGTNSFHNYKYMSDAALKAKIQPALVELGLIALQRMHTTKDEWVENAKGERSNYVTVSCTLTIIDVADGESETVTSLGSGADKGDKAIMKAQTAAHKYAWSHLLNIPTGDDPEADTSTDAHMNDPVVSEPRELPSGEIGHSSGVPISVRKKTDNPKSPWVITMPDGSYTTFNKDIATSAELGMSMKAPIEFDFRTEEYRGNVENKIVDPPKKKEAN